VGLEVQRPELIHAEDHLRLAGLGGDLTVGDRVQVLNPGLLDRVVRVGGGFPGGFQPLKGDAFRTEQRPQALMGDVVDHPLGHQELAQLVQAPGGKRQAMFGWPGLGDLLDLPALGEGELRRPAALVPGVKRAEPVGVEVMNHIADPVFAGERHLRDSGHVHPLARQQHHLRPPPGHHRPTVTAHDPYEPAALIVVDLTHSHTFGHRPSLRDHRSPDQGPALRANMTSYGTSRQMSAAGSRFRTWCSGR